MGLVLIYFNDAARADLSRPYLPCVVADLLAEAAGMQGRYISPICVVFNEGVVDDDNVPNMYGRPSCAGIIW